MQKRNPRHENAQNRGEQCDANLGHGDGGLGMRRNCAVDDDVCRLSVASTQATALFSTIGQRCDG